MPHGFENKKMKEDGERERERGEKQKREALLKSSFKKVQELQSSRYCT